MTTSKFAKECIEFKKYGSTNSNWLSNISNGDTVFISQFNYHDQNIFGPFKVTQPLFYDKQIIFPNQKYYYRVGLGYKNLRCINETDFYLNGIKSKKRNLGLRVIYLLQQNKHLHSICLNEQEGDFISDTLKNFGNDSQLTKNKDYTPEYNRLQVDQNFIANKNKLYSRLFFSSESDMEAFIIFCLKNNSNATYKSLDGILALYPENKLIYSTIYNQFIFGNAYPSDIVILNKNNTNIIELKKTSLEKNMIPIIEKEIIKYCTYSLYSDRVEANLSQINFFLIVAKDERNVSFKKYLEHYFRKITNKISHLKKFNFTIIEYYIENQNLLFTKI